MRLQFNDSVLGYLRGQNAWVIAVAPFDLYVTCDNGITVSEVSDTDVVLSVTSKHGNFGDIKFSTTEVDGSSLIKKGANVILDLSADRNLFFYVSTTDGDMLFMNQAMLSIQNEIQFAIMRSYMAISLGVSAGTGLALVADLGNSSINKIKNLISDGSKTLVDIRSSESSAKAGSRRKY